MDISYLVTPFFAWLVAGSVKFSINCYSEKRLAFDLIGYGGMPSNHAAIVSACAALIALKEGLDEPALLVAITLAFIVILDASSLRKQVGDQARTINKLSGDEGKHRERVGHTKIQILAGVFSGILSSMLVFYFFAT